MFQNGVDDRERINDQRIMRIAYAETDELKKIGADDVACSVAAAAVGDVKNYRVGIGDNVWPVEISWIDSDVMPRFAVMKLAAIGHRPIFEVRGKPVGVIEDEGRGIFIKAVAGKIGCANQARNNRCQRGGRVARAFLPAFLVGDRAVRDEVTSSATDDRPGLEELE